MNEHQRIADRNPEIRIELNEIRIEDGMADFGERQFIGSNRLTELQICLCDDVGNFAASAREGENGHMSVYHEHCW